MSMDYNEQYDKIYRYCYFRLGQREKAEDVTQETFLRFLKSYGGKRQSDALPLLYTIARNLCIDQYRRHSTEQAEDEPCESFEAELIEHTALRQELAKLPQEDRELLLLRYVNQVPLSVLTELTGLSRFALYRRCTALLKELRQKMEGD